MFATLLIVSASAHAPTSAPRSSNWPMCERSNSPARFRTASCSLRMLEYCTGISNPPNGTILAPSARWASCRAVRRSAPESVVVIVSSVLREDVPVLRQLAAKVQREREQAPVRLRVVEPVLAAQRGDVRADALRRGRGDVRFVAAGDERPVVVERGDVGVEAADVPEVRAQRARHLRVQ